MRVPIDTRDSDALTLQTLGYAVGYGWVSFSRVRFFVALPENQK